MHNDFVEFQQYFNNASQKNRERQGNPFGQASANTGWAVYQNSSDPSLGFHLFGRFVSNENDDGINTTDCPPITKYPKLKRWLPSVFFRRLPKVLRETDGVEEIPSAMARNFGTLDDGTSRGAIQNVPSENWNLVINDCWVLGGINNCVPFYAASVLNRANLYRTHGNKTGFLSIAGRELLGLVMAGYRAYRGHASLGVVMVCTGPDNINTARNYTLDDYAIAIDFIEWSISGSGKKDYELMLARAGINVF